MRNLLIFLLLSSSTLTFAELHASQINYDCAFDRYVSPHGSGKEDLSLSFIVDGEKAYITGINGSFEAMAIQNALGGITFLEFTGTRNVHVTAIDKTGFAAHSRSTIILDELVPSQYYGKCRKK